MLRTNRQTKQPEQVFKDEAPTPGQTAICRLRLLEEIYLVDPVVIVSLGAKACETLLGRPVAIKRDRGETLQITIPGASYEPHVSDKGHLLRRVEGSLVATWLQAHVRYLLIPTLHPAYVLRTLQDRTANSDFRHFVNDLKQAIRTYKAYQHTVFGTGLTIDADDAAELNASDFQEG